jgi:hypothetical protein
MPLTKADLRDIDVVDAYELKSDGRAATPFSVYLTTTSVSTTTGTNVVVSTMPPDGEGLLSSSDHPVQVGDFLFIAGSTPSGIADGKYIVASVVDDTTVTVEGVIATSTGGTLTWVYPAGASEVGFDPTGQSVTTATTVEQALIDIANASTGGVALTESQHKTLRQLVHLADGQGGPFEGFTSGAVRVTIGGAFPTNITWYTSNTLTSKIVEKQITYNSNKTPTTIYWAVYAVDGVTVLATAQDAINYTGAFEINRTRTLTDTPAPSFITEQQHKTLRQLIHLADGQGGPYEGFTSLAYRETLGGAFPTSVTWYNDSTKARKIVEKAITYTGSRQISTVTWRVYDVDGVTVLATVADSVTYSTFFETSRVRSIV